MLSRYLNRVHLKEGRASRTTGAPWLRESLPTLSPHFKHVQRLTISYLKWDFIDSTVLRSIQHNLVALPRLSLIDATFPSIEAYAMLVSAFPKLTSLHITTTLFKRGGQIIDVSDEPAPSIPISPFLQTLTVHEYSSHLESWLISQTHGPPLRKLVATALNIPERSTLGQMILHYADSLTELRLYFSYQSGMSSLSYFMHERSNSGFFRLTGGLRLRSL